MFVFPYHKNFIYLTILLFLVSFAGSSKLYAQPKTRIVWFSTLHEDLSEKSGFWKSVHDLVVAAAADLDVELSVKYAQENYIRMYEQANDLLSSPDRRPDGIIFHNYKRVGHRILEKAETAGVKSMVFNSGFVGQDKPFTPRKTYKHWIGAITPDDAYAGEELARQLHAQIKAKQTDGISPTEMIAMEGNRSSAAYLARKRGLSAYLAANKQVQLRQYFPADWSRTTAAEQFGGIYQRYPEVKIMWAANDNMALGLNDGARAQGRTPGSDFVVGGIDWLPEAIDSVNDGSMAVTIGGHFVEGMWALILLYDYLNGIDFAEEYGLQIKSKMLALTKEKLDGLGDIAGKFSAESLERFDFSSLSKFETPGLLDYPFDISHLLNGL